MSNDYFYEIRWKLTIQHTTLHFCVIVHYRHGFHRKCQWYCMLTDFLLKAHSFLWQRDGEQRWSDGRASGWRLSLCWQSLKATNQELVAGVLIVFLYVQGLDLGVGDAGTVLVDGEGRSTGETCLPGWGWVQRRTYSLWSGITESGRKGSEKQASRG